MAGARHHGGRGRRTLGSQLVAYNERAESVGSLIAIFTASSNYWVNTRNPRVNISLEKKARERASERERERERWRKRKRENYR